MNNRQQEILKAIIQEYQKTGQPVASQILVERYGFDLSPATIRTEMLALDKKGMLVQPYHSAGRVPTTKAYRLFVNELLKDERFDLEDREKIKKNLQHFEERRAYSFHIAKVLADFSQNLGLSGSFGRQVDFHEAGLLSIFEDDDFGRPENIESILHGFEALEKNFFDFFRKINQETEVFIGEENPIKDFKECALIVSIYESSEEKGLIGILGPKRMNYLRNISLIKETKNLLENARE